MIIYGAEFEEIISEKIVNGPIVTVYVCTYNHQEYIEDALEGIVNQNTEYPYEVVIVDDASTDSTIDIVNRYCEKYPQYMHGYIAKKNIFKHPERKKIYSYIKSKGCRGKYIAICEGDDYWIDNDKLQIQVDFLENHSDYCLTMHNAKCIDYKNNNSYLMKSSNSSHEIMADELILQYEGIWPTASMVLRKNIIFAEPFFFECGVGDWPMQLFALSQGKIFYFSKVMSVYRYMHSGSWSNANYDNIELKFKHYARITLFLLQYNEYTNDRFRSIINTKIQSILEECQLCISDRSKFVNLCNICILSIEKKYHFFFEELLRYNKYIIGHEYIEELIEYVSNHKSIYIMGTGMCSDILSNELKSQGITINGYVVSNDQKCQKIKNGYCVKKLKDIASDKNNVGIIVGINFDKRMDVENSLYQNDIVDYYCPFWFNIQRL